MKTNTLLKAVQRALFVVAISAGCNAYAGFLGDIAHGVGEVVEGAGDVATAPVRAVTGSRHRHHMPEAGYTYEEVQKETAPETRRRSGAFSRGTPPPRMEEQEESGQRLKRQPSYRHLPVRRGTY